MNYSKLNLTQKLTFIEEAITIALNDTALSETLAQFGMTQDHLSNGLSLREQLGVLDQSQQAEFGKRVRMTSRVDELYERVSSALRKDRAIVLAVLRDTRGVDNQLGLKGRLRRSREGLLRQSRNFYNEVLADADLKTLLEPYNFTEETILERLIDVESFANVMMDQQVQRAESLIATRKREDAMAQLDSWTAQFLGIARQAFREDREQLTKLGIRS